MELFGETIEREFPDLHRQGVRVRFIGRRDRCPESLRSLMDDMEERTVANTRLDLWVAFDYGGRAEIVQAVRELMADGVAPAAVDEERLARAPLRTRAARPRPGHPHERRDAHVELPAVAARIRGVRVPSTLWPDFGSAELEAALHAYAGRRRRFGGR